MTLYLPKYAHFTDKHEMDNAASRHLSANWNDLNGTDRVVLDVIRRYSVKHGAAHLKHETIAQAVSKSIDTVRRSIRKLVALGIIERVNFIRRVLSGLGANIYAILPIKDSNAQSELHSRSEVAKPTQSKEQPPKTENEPLYFKSINSIHTEDTLKRGLRDKMPAYIYDLMAPYLNESDMFNAYNRLLRGKASVDRTITFESNESLFSDAILSVFHAYKRGKVRSLLAVLYTAAQETSAQIYRQQHYTIPNWIDA